MNQEKIGKLIAKLRKEKGLTQQELGDKVGVGYRAVSKWETGSTLPDISIIKELSTILGISSDELLKGELNPKTKSSSDDKTTKHRPILLYILTPIIILTVIATIIISNNNKTYMYKLKAADKENYYVDGKVVFTGNNMSLLINKITFLDKNINKLEIKNYQYRITSDKLLIYAMGYSDYGVTMLESVATVKNLSKNLTINYTGENDRQDIINSNLILNIIFLDSNNNEISQNIELILAEQN